MRRNLIGPSLAAVVVVGAVACTDSTTAGVGLAFSTRNNPANLAVAQQGDSTVVALGNDTIIIRNVQLVLREIELKRVDDALDCPDSNASGSDDDACEEFETGPVLVELPLGNSTDKVITVEVPVGIYDEVQFEIHHPEAPEDATFIAAHPDFDGVSIRVTGTYSQAGTRSDFTFTTDLNQEQ